MNAQVENRPILFLKEEPALNRFLDKSSDENELGKVKEILKDIKKEKLSN